jgi:geranylgeranyl reductase family protein
VAGARFDVLVVGAGPAGSTAALVLARGGARVALLDKSTFPRDKACGDVIGPRGVQTLSELGLAPGGVTVADIEVVGPTGRRVRLPAVPGMTYPGYGLVVPRSRFDDWLRHEAIEAGAVPLQGRFDPGGGVSADVIIGADGALSRVASAFGLVDETRVLWGYAARTYAPGSPRLPQIHFWERGRWNGFPGYGWVFPGSEGIANVGLGIGITSDKKVAARVGRDLPSFIESTARSGSSGRVLGGWLKMGMVGTIPAAGRTLLVGDAAGLVNPLQGEGIAQALSSGRAAALAVLDGGPSGAARLYLESLERYAPFARSTASITAWMSERPLAVAAMGRFLTAPVLGRALARPWSLYWNGLVEGAAPGWPARGARFADSLARRLFAQGGGWLDGGVELSRASCERNESTVASTTRS